jgi:H+/Cl- antiporter ClcA
MTTTHSTSNASSPEKAKTFPKNFNRFAYAAFTLMGILYWFFGSDKSLAVSQMGIALIFDPFNPDQPFGQRPLYQKVWLFVHLGLVLGGFGWVVFK